MPAIVTDILRFPWFPIVIVALLGILYWRGAMTMRQKKDDPGAARRRENNSNR